MAGSGWSPFLPPHDGRGSVPVQQVWPGLQLEQHSVPTQLDQHSVQHIQQFHQQQQQHHFQQQPQQQANQHFQQQFQQTSPIHQLHQPPRLQHEQPIHFQQIPASPQPFQLSQVDTYQHFQVQSSQLSQEQLLQQQQLHREQHLLEQQKQQQQLKHQQQLKKQHEMELQEQEKRNNQQYLKQQQEIYLREQNLLKEQERQKQLQIQRKQQQQQLQQQMQQLQREQQQQQLQEQQKLKHLEEQHRHQKDGKEYLPRGLHHQPTKMHPREDLRGREGQDKSGEFNLHEHPPPSRMAAVFPAPPVSPPPGPRPRPLGGESQLVIGSWNEECEQERAVAEAGSGLGPGKLNLLRREEAGHHRRDRPCYTGQKERNAAIEETKEMLDKMRIEDKQMIEKFKKDKEKKKEKEKKLDKIEVKQIEETTPEVLGPERAPGAYQPREKPAPAASAVRGKKGKGRGRGRGQGGLSRPPLPGPMFRPATLLQLEVSRQEWAHAMGHYLQPAWPPRYSGPPHRPRPEPGSSPEPQPAFIIGPAAAREAEQKCGEMKGAETANPADSSN